MSPCSCSGDDSCRNCSLGSEKRDVQVKSAFLLNSYCLENPRIGEKSLNKLQSEVTKKVLDALWNKIQVDEFFMMDNYVIKTLKKKVIQESFHEIWQRRQELTSKYVVAAMESCIAQHYVSLVDSNLELPLPFPFSCVYCCKYSCDEKVQLYGKFPPKHMRAHMIEKCLEVIDTGVMPADKMLINCYSQCKDMIHDWKNGQLQFW